MFLSQFLQKQAVAGKSHQGDLGQMERKKGVTVYNCTVITGTTKVNNKKQCVGHLLSDS